MRSHTLRSFLSSCCECLEEYNGSYFKKDCELLEQFIDEINEFCVDEEEAEDIEGDNQLLYTGLKHMQTRWRTTLVSQRSSTFNNGISGDKYQQC
ncbi:hypothetical protein HK096_011355, partial [Nowakowskiella sp. JEL0078]